MVCQRWQMCSAQHGRAAQQVFHTLQRVPPGKGNRSQLPSVRSSVAEMVCPLGPKSPEFSSVPEQPACNNVIELDFKPACMTQCKVIHAIQQLHPGDLRRQAQKTARLQHGVHKVH